MVVRPQTEAPLSRSKLSLAQRRRRRLILETSALRRLFWASKRACGVGEMAIWPCV